MVSITEPPQHLDDLPSRLRATASRLLCKGVRVSENVSG
jgi:hypothetical protein